MVKVLAGMILAALLCLTGAGAFAGGAALAPQQVATILGATWELQEDDNFTCTATAFAETQAGTYLVTARHCVVEAEASPAMGKTPAQPVKLFTDETINQGAGPSYQIKTLAEGVDAGHDWAVVFAKNVQSPSVLPLGDAAGATYGTPVGMGGYPYGLGPIVVAGEVSGLGVSAFGTTYLTVDITGAPGNSGSGVVDLTTMSLIGVLVAGYSNPDQPAPPVVLCTPIQEVTFNVPTIVPATDPVAATGR